MLIVVLLYERFLIEGKKKEMKVNKLLKLTMAAILTIAMATPALAGTEAEVESYGSLEKEGDVSQFVYDNPSVTVPSKTSSVVGASAIPSRYDLRKLNQVTSVKDQGLESYCWTFSAMASFESNLIKKGLANSSLDLSEAHLACYTFNGKDNGYTSIYGGKDTYRNISDGASNHYAAAATLARGYGAVKESLMPYSAVNKSAYKKNNAMRIKHTYFLNDADFIYLNPYVSYENRTKTRAYVETLDSAGMNSVKNKIRSSGAVAAMICIPNNDASCFGTNKPSEMTSYYYTEVEANHTVTVVGWDDNYPKSNFKSGTPKGNGAWLVKNSWGTTDGGETLHDKGYFWVSYYSPSINEFTSFTGEKSTGRTIYQYDGVGPGDDMLYTNIPVYSANVFTARRDILIDRVSTWTPEANMKVNIKIYVNKQNSSPVSGTLLYNRTYKETFAGYHTINLKTTAGNAARVGIPKGSKFTIAIRITNNKGTKYYFPFETKINNSYISTINPAMLSSGRPPKGQTFLKVSNQKWTDIYYFGKVRQNSFFNALAKGHALKSGKKAQKVTAKSKIKIKKGKKKKIIAKRVRGNGKLVYRSTNQKIVTVTKTGIIKAKKRGKAKIVINALPTTKCKAAKKTVTVVVK